MKKIDRMLIIVELNDVVVHYTIFFLLLCSDIHKRISIIKK